MIKFLRLKAYNTFLKALVEGKEDFILEYTNYTKKIRHKGDVYHFNEEGKNDIQQLNLINRVRRDVVGYKRQTYATEKDLTLFKLFNIPTDTPGFKLDVTSAYWQYAINNGVLSNGTVKFLNNLDRSIQEKKKMRLKALGSLATTKTINHFIKGKINYDLSETHTQETKGLYIEIKQGIDQMMQGLSKDFNLYYYFVDCVFSDDNKGRMAEYLAGRNYMSKAEDSKFTIINLGSFIKPVRYLVSINDNKLYFVRNHEYGEIYSKSIGG
jgi:hypothetical protein